MAVPEVQRHLTRREACTFCSGVQCRPPVSWTFHRSNEALNYTSFPYQRKAVALICRIKRDFIERDQSASASPAVTVRARKNGTAPPMAGWQTHMRFSLPEAYFAVLAALQRRAAVLLADCIGLKNSKRDLVQNTHTFSRDKILPRKVFCQNKKFIFYYSLSYLIILT